MDIDQPQNSEEDPFKYCYVAGAVDEILDISYDFPDYFPLSEAFSCLASYFDSRKDRVLQIPPDKFETDLRQFTLSYVRKLCSKCTRCELHQNRELTSGKGSVFGDGVVDSDVIVVGEGPGEYEARAEIPFVGQVALRASTCAMKCQNFEECFYTGRKDPLPPYSFTPNRKCTYDPQVIPKEQLVNRLTRRTQDVHTSGAILEHALSRAGFRRHTTYFLQRHMQRLEMKTPESNPEPNVYLTNAVRCRSVKQGDRGEVENVNPTPAQIDACRPWLLITQRLVKPKVRVALGSVSLEALGLPKQGITKRANSFERATDGVPVAIALHPAYIMRQPEAERILLEKDLVETLASARKLAADELF